MYYSERKGKDVVHETKILHSSEKQSQTKMVKCVCVFVCFRDGEDIDQFVSSLNKYLFWVLGK